MALPSITLQRPRHRLPVTRTLWPGRAGAIKLTRRYGEALVCVRHRRDAAGLRRITTVELVVEVVDVQRRLVEVHLPWDADPAIRAAVQAAGGRWDGKRKVWKLPSAAARKLDALLRAALMPDDAPPGRMIQLTRCRQMLRKDRCE